MALKEITTDRAPMAIGTYSQGVRLGGVAYLSGQIPIDPTTGQMISGDVSSQVRQIFSNLSAVAQAAGLVLGSTVKLTVFLTDMGDYATVNSVMEEFFSKPYPARSAVVVKELPRHARLEIEAIVAE